MSYADAFRVTTIRTWTCDGCGITRDVVEQHEPPHDAAYFYMGRVDLLDPPKEWLVRYRPTAHFHDEACALAAAKRDLHPVAAS